MAESLRDIGPIGMAVEVDPDPATRSDVRRPKVPLRSAREQKILRHVGGLAPDRMAASAVVVSGVREAGEHLLADPERGFAV
jgi:hypothetical protein